MKETQLQPPLAPHENLAIAGRLDYFQGVLLRYITSPVTQGTLTSMKRMVAIMPSFPTPQPASIWRGFRENYLENDEVYSALMFLERLCNDGSDDSRAALQRSIAQLGEQSK